MNLNHGPYVKPALEASAGGIHQLFVYGTLKVGEANHHVLGDKRILKGHARAPGFVMVDLGAFPGAVSVPNGGWHIYGEVYEINDAALAKVDSLEGHPRFYERSVIDLERFGKTWIYTLPRKQYLQNGCRFIPCGRWSRASQAYVFNEERLSASYQVDRPLIPALPVPGRTMETEKPGIVVPEIVPEATCQVGPGWEEA